MAVTSGAQGAVKISLLHARFGKRSPYPLVQHSHDAADDFKVAQFLGGDVEQHILAPDVVLGDALCEVTHGGREFALRTAELFKHEARQHWIRFPDSDSVLKLFIVHEHKTTSGVAAWTPHPPTGARK
jgi:hypothetical protein